MSQDGLSLCSKEEFLGQFPKVIDVVLKDLEKEDMVGLTMTPLPQKGVVCVLFFLFFPFLDLFSFKMVLIFDFFFFSFG